MSLLRFKWSICLFFGQAVSFFLLTFISLDFASAISCGRYFEIRKHSNYQYSVEFWSNFQAAYDANYIANLKQNRVFYNRNLQHSDHIKILERFLGYDFTHRRPNRKTVEEALQSYEKVMRTHVQRGVISEYLKPAFAFVNVLTSEVKLISYGDLIPQGFTPHRSLLSRKDFFNAIANGKFVIGFPVNTNFKSYNTVIDHDYAHLSTFMQHPIIVPELLRLARNYKGIHKDESHNDFALYLPFEVWNYISRESAREMRGFTEGIISKKESFVSTQEILVSLRRMSDVEFYKFFDELLNLQDQWVQYAGGSFRDIVTKMNLMIDVNRGFYTVEKDNEFLSGVKYLSKLQMYQVARAVLRAKTRVNEEGVPAAYVHTNFREVDMQIAANILALMDGLSKISIAEAYRSFSEEGFIPGSVLDKMYNEIDIRNIKQTVPNAE